ncbi:hypothetical protein RhiirB3_460737 [Rhizophagus irregularis]|nr:hypothetical protein RhiirB3_460737 [Rhizophagus irregularis]
MKKNMTIVNMRVRKEFSSWELAESYLDKYAKQQGFCLRKKRCIPDPNDKTITRRRTGK